MQGDSQRRSLERQLLSWQRASTLCSDKLRGLQETLDGYEGPDRQVLEDMVAQESDLCVQMRQHISRKVHELVLHTPELMETGKGSPSDSGTLGPNQ